MKADDMVPRIISNAEWVTINGSTVRSWNIKLAGLLYEQFETIGSTFPEAVFKADKRRKE